MSRGCCKVNRITFYTIHGVVPFLRLHWVILGSGFPKIGCTFLGVPIVRIRVIWYFGIYIGAPYVWETSISNDAHEVDTLHRSSRGRV